MGSQKKNYNSGATGASRAESAVNDVKNNADQVVNQAKEKAGQVADQAQQKAKSQLSERKDQVADSVNSVAQALRRTGEELQGQQAGTVGDYVSKAANKLSELSTHLHDNDIDDLMRDAEKFARREPAIFLGGAFALGVIAARFLKSSNKSASTWRDDAIDGGYARDQYSSQGSYAARLTTGAYGSGAYSSAYDTSEGSGAMGADTLGTPSPTDVAGASTGGASTGGAGTKSANASRSSNPRSMTEES